MPRDGCSDIGETAALADRASAWRAGNEDGYLFARMIAAGPRRITTVISGDDQKVPGFQSFDQLRESRIECFEGSCVARHVPPVAVDRIEVDKICEQQPAIRQVVPAVQHAIEQRVIAVAPLVEPGSAMGEDVVDLADRHHLAVLCGDIQNGWFGRRYCEVASVRSSLEIATGRSHKGSRDHAADVKGINQPSSHRTDLIKSLQSKDLLVSGDLKYAVGRRVADRHPGLQMLFPEFRNDVRA